MNATPSGCKAIHSWSLLYLICVGPDAEYVNGSSALLSKFFVVALLELHLRNNFKVLRGIVAILEERDRAVRSANILPVVDEVFFGSFFLLVVVTVCNCLNV